MQKGAANAITEESEGQNSAQMQAVDMSPTTCPDLLATDHHIFTNLTASTFFLALSLTNLIKLTLSSLLFVVIVIIMGVFTRSQNCKMLPREVEIQWSDR